MAGDRYSEEPGLGMVTDQYIVTLRDELRRKLQGSHLRIQEIEALRYLEEPIALSPSERPTGLEVRVGLTAELIENVKSALTANRPHVRLSALREGSTAQSNSSDREAFWDEFLDYVNYGAPVLQEFVDAQAGLGIGILKAAYYPWPKDARKRKAGQTDTDYLDQQRALKKKWGPPFRVVTVHPLAVMFELGDGCDLARVIDYSYKSKRDTYERWGLSYDEPVVSSNLSTAVGHPAIESVPYGVASADTCTVTEYWTTKVHIILIDDRRVYEQSPPDVRYFIAVGRTNSSKDPDKFGMSVAEVMRHVEPHVNRTITRMAEAAELLVRKRLAVELPEGSTEDLALGEDNMPQANTWEFTPDRAKALPAGAQIRDPFMGAEHVYEAMPMINLLLQMAGQHGIAPIFKGIPPGAAGSGYRDNSLYMMARSQFQYLVEAYASCLGRLIEWLEDMVVLRVKQPVYLGNLELKPKDISEYPVKYRVDVDPYLPQNVIAEGQFYDAMWAHGHVGRRIVIEEGIKKGQPDAIMRERMLEDIQDLLKPALYMDVLQTLGIPLPGQQPAGAPQLLGPNGEPIGQNPMAPMEPSAPGGAQQLTAAMSRGGQSRQPPNEPGSTIQTNSQ